MKYGVRIVFKDVLGEETRDTWFDDPEKAKAYFEYEESFHDLVEINYIPFSEYKE